MIKETLNEISLNFNKLSDSEAEINDAIQVIISSLKNGKKIMFCGNGGSAADSQHLAAELIGRYRINRPPLSALALSTDTSTITAVANDFSFNEIFSRQVKALSKEGDVLYAISTSGKSQNILMAIEEAKLNNVKVIGITGEEGGEFIDKCDVLIKVPSGRPDRIQEMHIAVGQIICEEVENYFFN